MHTKMTNPLSFVGFDDLSHHARAIGVKRFQDAHFLREFLPIHSHAPSQGAHQVLVNEISYAIVSPSRQPR